MRIWEFHTARDRRPLFDSLDQAVWLEPSLLRTWVVVDPELIIGVFQDPRARILSIHELVDRVAESYGIELPNLRFAAQHLPLFLEGEAHRDRRQAFARYLAARLPELDSRIVDLVQSHLEPLGQKGSVDLVADVVAPLVREVTSIFVGRPLPSAADSLDLLDLFALNKSLGRFTRLEQRVEEALDLLDRNEEDLLGVRFTSLVLGFETLMTVLAEGLYMAFSAPNADGHAALPAHPVETGVPISYRRAETGFDLGGHPIGKGDLLRLQLQTIGYSADEALPRRMFGAGPHACVGKHVSLRIWEEVKRIFDAMHLVGQVTSYQVAPSHYILRHRHIHVDLR